jgi:hypothetical protein
MKNVPEAMKFTFAKYAESFEVRFSTVKRDSGLLEAYGRNRAAIEALKNSFNELKKNGLIESVKDNKIIDSKGRTNDVVYTIFPTIKFAIEVKASNKRLGDAKKNTHDTKSSEI